MECQLSCFKSKRWCHEGAVLNTPANLENSTGHSMRKIVINVIYMYGDRGHWTYNGDNHSVVSDSLQPHELQHARLPCPPPTPRVHSDSRPSSPWCHLILCRPLLLLPPIPPSIRVFSNEYPGLISFRMDWLDPLAVQGTLNSLLQHHSSKAQFNN